tara:strand:- start:1346 stop:1630 length:285 start_codon:yes stop_codon:yes gene_type:complete
MASTELLGFIGTTIIVVAYLPQIRHIINEHCSGGVSLRAWIIWLIATAFIGIHSVSTGDKVFITLQVVNFLAILTIILLIVRFKGKACHSINHK